MSRRTPNTIRPGMLSPGVHVVPVGQEVPIVPVVPHRVAEAPPRIGPSVEARGPVKQIVVLWRLSTAASGAGEATVIAATAITVKTLLKDTMLCSETKGS